MKLRWPLAGTVFFILAVHCGLLTHSAVVHSPVVSEVPQLPAGLLHLNTGSFNIFHVNPPLVRTIAALPLLAIDYSVDWRHQIDRPDIRPHLAVGADFVQANGERSIMLYRVARLACIPFSIVGCLVCYLWASKLFGPLAGLVALIQWAFCPEILGHGALITADAAGAALGALAAYTFWLWLCSPTFERASISGICLGIACLAKFTFFVFFPLWVIAAVCFCSRVAQREGAFTPSLAKRLGHVMLMWVAAITVINVGYLFEGSFRPIGSYAFTSDSMSRVSRLVTEWPEPFGAWLKKIPIPLPEAVVVGVDLQKSDFEVINVGYLWGHWKLGGWWYYYFAGYWGKLPCGWLLTFTLATLSSINLLKTGRVALNAVFVLLPMAAVLLLCSSQQNMSLHLRYALPALPFAFVWTSQIAIAGRAFRMRIVRVVALGALAWSVISSLLQTPHWLAYRNEFVDDTPHGVKCVLGSNYAFGQDLLYLKEWYDQNPNCRPVYTAIITGMDLRGLGIEHRLAPALSAQLEDVGPPRGWYVVDTNYLNGAEIYSAGNFKEVSGHKDYIQPRVGYAYLSNIQPKYQLGATIYVFDLSDSK